MDNKNNNTKHFIIGLLSGILIIPVIEEFLNVILVWIQVLLIKPNRIVLKSNKELSELQEAAEYQQSSCIGFQVSNDDEEYDEYEE